MGAQRLGNVDLDAAMFDLMSWRRYRGELRDPTLFVKSEV
jgi:hypothetical protein